MKSDHCGVAWNVYVSTMPFAISVIVFVQLVEPFNAQITLSSILKMSGSAGERLQKNRLALLLFYELCFLTTINMVVIRMGAFAFKRVGWFNERLREAAKVQVYFIRCDESYRTENDDCTQKNRTDGQTTLIPVEQNTGLSLNRLQAKDMMWARRPSHWTVWK